MTREEVQRRLKNALWNFYSEDGYLLEIDVHERTIAHKLGEHLQREFLPPENGRPYKVDCEYNKNSENNQVGTKTISLNAAEREIVRRCRRLRRGFPVGGEVLMRIMPDIIVHKRNTNKNLLILEIKRSRNHNNSEIACDKLKLRKYTCRDEGTLKYTFGAFININTGTERSAEGLCSIEWYERGASAEPYPLPYAPDRSIPPSQEHILNPKHIRPIDG